MKISILILILFFIISVNTSFSQEKKTIIIGGDEEDIYTYPFKTPKGELNGICYTIVEKVAAELGIKIDYKLMPFYKLLQEAKDGKIDAAMPIIKKKGRLEYLFYPENGIWVEENYLVTLDKHGINYSGDLDNLKNYPIGVVKEYSYGDKLDKAIDEKKIQTTTYIGNRMLFEQLKNGALKMVVGNKHTSQYFKRILNIDDLILLDPYISKDMLYLTFSKKRQGYEELAKRFSDGIERFRRSEEFKKMLDKYGFHIQTVKIAADDRPPYYSLEMPNNGPIAEIITQAFKRVGYEVKIDFLPWRKVLEKVKTGKYDAGFAAYYSEQRSKEYLFSEPIGIYSPESFLKKKSLEVSFKKWEDLNSYRIGITRGYVYDDADFDNATFLNKIESNSEKNNIENLIKGRLDIVVIDKSAALYLIDKIFKDNKKDLDFLDFANKKNDLHLLISKRFEISGQLKRDFDYGLRQIKKDGTSERILKKYGYAYETNKK